MAQNYATQTGGGVLTREAMTDALRNAPPGRAAYYGEYWDSLARCLPRDPAEFAHSVSQLRERAAERDTGDALAQGNEILTRGAQDGDVLLRGHADARSWVSGEFARIERDLLAVDSPEGDMRTEQRQMAEAYSAAEADQRTGTAAIATGLPSLDIVLGGGLRRGELDLVVAFTSVGKTGLCCQLAWDAVVRQGKNCVFFTTETLRPQVRVKILSRHTRQFAPRGLNSRDIKAGTLARICPLDRHQSGCRCGPDLFAQALGDFTSNQSYGHLHIAQVPRGATVSTLEQRLRVISREWEADLVVVDYLMLLRAETLYRSKRETLAEIINDAKSLATGYRDGLGVPVVSPWQVNKEGFQTAKGLGMYDLEATAETAEARNTADLVISLLASGDDQNTQHGRHVSIKLDVLKNRDGERGTAVNLVADYATSCFTEEQAVEQPDSDELLRGLPGS